MLKIRLSRYGKKNKPSYKIIVSDVRFPRNGKFIEKIGFFNNENNKNKFNLNLNKFNYWINIGSKVTKRVKFLIKKYIKKEDLNNN